MLFDLVQNEAGQRLIEFFQENALVIQQPREDSTHGHHQMVNTEIRLITFFAAKDGVASSAASSVRPPRPKKEPQALIIPKNAAEEQKLKLERLMKNPVRRGAG